MTENLVNYIWAVGIIIIFLILLAIAIFEVTLWVREYNYYKRFDAGGFGDKAENFWADDSYPGIIINYKQWKNIQKTKKKNSND